MAKEDVKKGTIELVAIHKIEGSKGQFSVDGSKTASLLPGQVFVTDVATGDELVAGGAAKNVVIVKVAADSDSAPESEPSPASDSASDL